MHLLWESELPGSGRVCVSLSLEKVQPRFPGVSPVPLLAALLLDPGARARVP